jgi:predicted homoserine dehydrogenase-like protein
MQSLLGGRSSSGLLRASSSLRCSFLSTKAGERPARVIVIGSGRMGHIRSSLLRSNPKFELVGIVDTFLEGAQKLADNYRVSSIVRKINDFERSVKNRFSYNLSAFR